MDSLLVTTKHLLYSLPQRLVILTHNPTVVTKAAYHKETYMCMLISALFIIAKLQKQPNYLSIEKNNGNQMCVHVCVCV